MSAMKKIATAATAIAVAAAVVTTVAPAHAEPAVTQLSTTSSGGSSKPGGQGGQGGPTVDANVGLKGGSSDPRCVATLIGVGLPLLAIIPLALSTQLATPGLGAVGNQLSRALTDAARAAGTTPEALAGIGGGVLGLFAAVVAIAGGANCIPNVDSAAVSLGSAKPAPVVPTETTEEATPTEEQ